MYEIDRYIRKQIYIHKATQILQYRHTQTLSQLDRESSQMHLNSKFDLGVIL